MCIARKSKTLPFLILHRKLIPHSGTYVPPRAGWRQGANDPDKPSKPLSPIYGSPAIAELPSHASPNPNPNPDQSQQQPARAPSHAHYPSGDNYYEDIDPRFAEPEPAMPTAPPSVHPTSLMPGGQTTDRNGPPTHLQPSTSYDSIQEGTRSLAESDVSNYTSISQRGVNPDWRPGPGEMTAPALAPRGVLNRKPLPQQQRDVLLQNNPDFELGSGLRGNGGGDRGGTRQQGQIPEMPAAGAERSRYPGAAF